MDAREPHRVVSVRARPSSWPLVERSWLRASKGGYDEILFNPHEGIAARAAEPINKLSDCQRLVRARAP
jgi:hypothetical protein